MQISDVYNLYALAVHFWGLLHLYRRIYDTFRMPPLKCCWCHVQPLKHHYTCKPPN